MRWNTSREAASLRRLSTLSVLVGALLIAIALLATVQRWLPDVVSTALGILGVAGLILGVSTGARAILEAKPDEDRPGPWVSLWKRRDD